MTDSSRDPDPGVGPEPEPPAGMPRWVKVFGIIAIIVVVFFVIVLLTGGPGSHGPGRHTGGLGSYASPVSQTARGG